MRRALLLTLLCLLGLGAGCSSEDAEQTALPSEFETFKETVLAHEDAIAECMQEQGFDYVADVPADFQLEEAAVRAEHEGDDPDAAVEELGSGDDPNEGILEGLSESELEAWYDAVWGQEEDPSDIGCFDSTYEAVWGVDPLDPDDDASEIVDEIVADSRVVEAEEDYIACMGDRGYDVADLQDIFRLIDRRGEAEDGDEPDPWKEEAYDNHDECRAAYDDVYDEVYLEYFSEADQ